MNINKFKNKNPLPLEIEVFLLNKKIRCININHTSGDLVYNIDNQYILKISTNHERLEKEKNVNDYLNLKLPTSKSVLLIKKDNYSYYIKTRIEGIPLVSKKYLKNPYKLIKLLKEAIDIFHNCKVDDCKIFNNYSQGDILIHGDFCLPNILVKNNKIVGFIDTEAAGLGDPWADYAWCIWSFEYNLKTKDYTHLLLKELKIEYDEEKYNYYINI